MQKADRGDRVLGDESQGARRIPYTRQADAGDAAPGRDAAWGGLLRRNSAIVVRPPAAPKEVNGHGAATPLLEVTKLHQGIIRARDLTKPSPCSRRSPRSSRDFKAVDASASQSVTARASALVGANPGCASRPASMMVMRLIDPSDGTITFDGEDIGASGQGNSATCRCASGIQMVFRIRRQPLTRASPRCAPSRTRCLRLGDPSSGRDAVRSRCEDLARQLGLPARIPRPLSPFSSPAVRRRASGIARAIALNPSS